MHEAVIVDAIRTPIGKRNGHLREIHPVDLLAKVLGHVIVRNDLNPTVIDDVIIGCVSQVGEQSANIGRNAWLAAGLPDSVPATTLDRQCGSGLQALHFAAQGVMAGAYDAVIAGGVESMSRVPLGSSLQNPGTPRSPLLQERYHLRRPWFDQSVGAQMIAEQLGFARTDLDEYSFRSHQLAQQATKQGLFAKETLPIELMQDGQTVLFQQDEGIRSDTSLERLAQLRPAFDGLDRITAGNASQISDGASAVLVMSRERAEQLNLRPRARFRSFAVTGVDPVTMLTGPISATKKVLSRAGLSVSDIDLFEVNEAFASVVLAWQHETGAPMERVNVHGGAIALGHPLGATGSRITATLLNALETRCERFGLMAICEGGGMANATILERLDD